MSKLLYPFVFVQQKNVYMIERLGTFSRVMEAGLNFKIPLLESVAYQHSLKEQVLAID